MKINCIQTTSKNRSSVLLQLRLTKLITDVLLECNSTPFSNNNVTTQMDSKQEPILFQLVSGEFRNDI